MERDIDDKIETLQAQFTLSFEDLIKKLIENTVKLIN